MPIPTPFHPRTSALCTSLLWKEWSGCHAVRSFDTTHDREYYAFRHSAGLLDVSPLTKVEVAGEDAGRFLARVMARDVSRLPVGRVAYVCWCDDDGKVVDDGTVARLDERRFRVTANHPALGWLARLRRRERVVLRDVSREVAALALQGPTSRRILEQVSDVDLSRMRFFRIRAGRLAGVPVEISRTGYTGDLGYEVWTSAAHALEAWDAIVEAGRDLRLQPAGLDALDVARIEAGFILNGVDYFSAQHCLIEARKSSPYEAALGWTVELEREPFVGSAALEREKRVGSRWALVGLVYDQDEYEALYHAVGLPPHAPAAAWRTGVPVFAEGRQVGQATSGAWSPMLKRHLALATVLAPHGATGERLEVEVTVEYRRHRIGAQVTKTPFFDPPRKRA